MPSKSLLLSLAAMLVVLPASLPAQQAAKSPAAASESTWQAAIKARREQLIQQNGPGTDAALRSQLLIMRDKDQVVRGFAGGKQVSGMTPDMLAKMPATDAELTSELKQIVDQKGWPTISL
ncbi:MAG: hypothetical protein ABI177_01755, partial [Edaphobacter sp.]